MIEATIVKRRYEPFSFMRCSSANTRTATNTAIALAIRWTILRWMRAIGFGSATYAITLITGGICGERLG